MAGPHTISRQTLQAGKFLKYQEILWQDAQGQKRKWEVVERIIGAEAVLIIPWLQPSNTLVLVRQYRPPVDGFVIEFPAGLIEPGEKPAAAAIRELREEAGFEGSVVSILPPTFNTPGLSGETVYNVLMCLPDGQTPQPQPDDGEHIELVLLPEAQIEAFLREQTAAGTKFDSKVLSYLSGMVAARAMHTAGWQQRVPGAPL